MMHDASPPGPGAAAGNSLVAGGVDAALLRTRAIDLAAHAVDASHYHLTPDAVVLADDVDDVARVLSAATKARLGVTFRSGGTSLSGQAVTDQVLVDTRRGFRGVTVLEDGFQVRAGAGTTVRAVNAALKPFGRRIGPDPASEGACTIGGVVANNSSGMSCGTHANTYRTLVSMDVLLPSGTRLETGDPEADEQLRSREPHLHRRLGEIRDRLREDPESVGTIRRLFAMKNTMGYGVNSFLDFDKPIDILAHLMIGSEGTLGFVSAATFSTVPAPEFTVTGLLIVPTLAEAVALVPQVADLDAASIELLDARSLQVAASHPHRLDGFDRGELDAHAALLIEFQAQTADELAEIERGATGLFPGGSAGTQMLTRDAGQRGEMWRIRKGLYSLVAGERPAGTTSLLEDVAVPPESLEAAGHRIRGLLDDFRYENGVIFGHAKDGNLHFMVNEQFEDSAGVERYAAFTDAMVDVVLELGGTLKAEHGTGRVMAPFVRRQYGDRLYDVMREVKSLCDGAGILNPGVLLTDDADLHLRDLKIHPRVEQEVDRCTECGYCEPVCPSKDLTLTPRQRIAVRRAIADSVSGGDESRAAEIAEQYTYDGLQTCAADGMCQTACPVAIDTGSLVRRLRAEAAPAAPQRAGLAAARHWDGTTTAVRRGLSVAARVPAATTMLTRAARGVLGHETIPLYSALPAGGLPRPSWDATDPAAIVIPSCTTEMFGTEGPDVLASLRSLCAKAGVEIGVPDRPGTLCCGTPWSSKGLLDGYDHMAGLLRDAVDQMDPTGRLPVIADASSCSEGLGKVLSASGRPVEDAVTFVVREVMPRLAIDVRPGRLAVHPTCSSHRQDGSQSLLAMARAVSEDVFVPQTWGCCGFAGDRGMLHPELTASATSVQAAEVVAAKADEHVSCNRTCELGMSRATGEDYRHILQVLDEQARPLA